MCTILDQSLINHKNIPVPLEVPRDLVPALLFSAPLQNSLNAQGKGSSVTPTFTRATTATYLNSSTGLVTNVASGVARYQNNRTLIEAGRTNQLVRSEELENVAWTAFNITIFDDDVVAPDGNTTADRLQDGAIETQYHLIRQDFTRTTGARVAISCYAKNGSRNWIYLGIGNTAGNDNVMQCFDIENGVVGGTVTQIGSFTVNNAKIIPIGTGGWYRCEVVMLTPAGTDTRAYVGLASADQTIVYTGSYKAAYFWGIQAEDYATHCSSYIPTTDATVTRNKDQLSYPVSNMPATAPGTVVMFADGHDDSTLLAGCLLFTTRDGEGQQGLTISYNSDFKPRFSLWTDTQQINTVLTTAATRDVHSLFAVAFDTNDGYLCYRENGESDTDNAADMPTSHAVIVLGSGQGYTYQVNGHLSKLLILNVRMSAFDIARLN